MSNPKEHLFQILDYREFLREHFAYLKKTEKMSLRKLAHKAGLSSHTFLKQIMDGDRDASATTARKLATAFGFNDKESEHFELIVAFSQTEDLKEKDTIYRRILKIRPMEEFYQLKEKQYELINEWYHVAIREMVALPQFQEDPSWISKQLGAKISPKLIKKSIQLLLDLELLARNEEGRLTQTENAITTGNESGEFALCNYHFKMLELSGESIYDPPIWRDISAVSMLVDRTEFQFIKKEMQLFRKRIMQYLEDRKEKSYESDELETSKELYQMNMQLFGLTKAKWKDNNPQ